MKTSINTNSRGGPAGAAESAPGTLCPQIEIDLSAMVDGELDPASVRRVLVHSDVCPSCRAFLEGIRTQLRAHREVAAIMEPEEGDAGARARELREQLIQNRHQLSRILYELGRGYVLMGMLPSFSRLVAREPVPIPDMHMRGRSLVDEVSRSGVEGDEWVHAKELFEGDELRSPSENMARGKRLLNEALMLRPDFHEARIYLGHAYHVSEERDHARREFRAVLESSSDPVTRAFALENLGNVYLEEGRREESIQFFEELIESGAVAHEPRFFTAYFNLALANGLLEQFDRCRHWLQRLYDEFPHKRRIIGQELHSRAQLANVLRDHPTIMNELVSSFPEWFSSAKEAC